MIPRYTHPDMGRIWSDERRYRTWLEVEVAAADAMAAEVRLYDQLFKRQDPGAEGDVMAALNPESAEILKA